MRSSDDRFPLCDPSTLANNFRGSPRVLKLQSANLTTPPVLVGSSTNYAMPLWQSAVKYACNLLQTGCSQEGGSSDKLSSLSVSKSTFQTLGRLNDIGGGSVASGIFHEAGCIYAIAFLSLCWPRVGTAQTLARVACSIPAPRWPLTSFIHSGTIASKKLCTVLSSEPYENQRSPPSSDEQWTSVERQYAKYLRAESKTKVGNKDAK